MKKLFAIAIVAAGLLAVVVTHVQRDRASSDAAARAADLARIQRDYYERVGWIRSNPDERSYKSEVSTFLRWYFGQADAHRKKFEIRDQFDSYLKELDTREKAGEERVEDRKANWEYAKQVFDSFRSGQYAPAHSFSDKGMRLDLVSTGVQRVGGTPKIRIPIVLWGAQREVREESVASSGVTAYTRKKMLTSAYFRQLWKLYDERKLYAEMPVDGDPIQRIDHPERLIAEFPPQLVIGYYELDLLPAEIQRAEVTFTVASRSPSGGDAMAQFVWKLDLPAEWKLSPGQEWKGAEHSVRPREEIEGKSSP
ncbi:MAG: hypothetical protein HYZ28_09755 [Myxococcales bacterium]|nr:hypothetical protein [Myxococcales bacterium]